MQNQLKYLKHKQINRQLWDACIENSSNELIYAYTWYLDIVAPGWEGMVYGNYEAVMPLPVRIKFGYRYIFIPYFSQQLGVFSKSDEKSVESFLDAIPGEFKLIDINLNEANTYKGKIKRLNKNYKIKLAQSYTSILKAYNRNCNRNIKKAVNAGYTVQYTLSPDQFVSFVQNNLSDQLDGIGKDVYKTLEKLVLAALDKGKGELVCVKDKSGETQATAFYLFSKSRLIFSVCASTKVGKVNQAMYLLVDTQIRKYAGKIDWYDFSGSNKKGIAYFNSTFGSAVSEYLTVSINRLPWWIRFIKK